MKKCEQCVYCRNRDGSTRDHVPPKQMFPDPKPSDLVSVPSCEQCGPSYQKDEEYFRALFRFTGASSSQSRPDFWSKVDRQLNRSPGLRRTIGKSIKRMDLVTPEGIYVGQRLTIESNWQRIATVTAKLVRGLYWFEYGSALPSDVFIDCPDFHAEHIDLSEMHSLTACGKRSWPGTFRYKCNRIEEDVTESMWLFQFYETHVFTAFSSKHKVPE